MISALGSHRFNPQTGLWELVSLENVAGVEMSLPAVAEVGAGRVAPGVGADGPVFALPDSGLLPPWGDVVIVPVEPVVPVSPPQVIPGPDGLIIVGGLVRTVLEGGEGNDLIVAGAQRDVATYPDDPSSVIFGHTDNTGPLRLFMGVSGDEGDTLRGGFGEDTLIGNELDNLLVGGGGRDVMIGGHGFDTYWVDNAEDIVIEQGNELGSDGLDLVVSTVNYELPDNVEYLILAPGAGDLVGVGNSGNNYLWGNEGRNLLIGGGGDDELEGMGGSDTLVGGEGDDFYLVDDAGDLVVELDNEGNDAILTSINYTLPGGIEDLHLFEWAGDVNLSGNDGNNRLTGSGGKNCLDGGAGNDWLKGAGGGDSLFGGEGQDTFDFGSPRTYGVMGETLVLDFQNGIDKIVGGWHYVTNSWLGEYIFEMPLLRQDESDTIVTLYFLDYPGAYQTNVISYEIRLAGVDVSLIDESDFVLWFPG
jgi:Ca2+-binding RTX toxin-like protein